MNFSSPDPPTPPSANTPADAKQQADKAETMKQNIIIGVGGFLIVLVLGFAVTSVIRGGKIDKLETNINELNTQITGLKEEVATLENKNRELATSESQANQKYKELVGQIDERQKMIDFLKKESSKFNTAAETQQKEAEEAIAALKTNLAESKKAYETTITELEATIKNKDEAIQSLKRSIK